MPWPRGWPVAGAPPGRSSGGACEPRQLRSPAAHLAAAGEPGWGGALAQPLLRPKRCGISAAGKGQPHQKGTVQSFPEKTVNAATFYPSQGLVFFF